MPDSHAGNVYAVHLCETICGIPACGMPKQVRHDLDFLLNMLTGVKYELKTRRAFNFAVCMRIWFFLYLVMVSTSGFSQEKTVSGILFDKVTKDRIASVNVRNTTSGKSVYNNLKGEFTVEAREGDQLIFSRQDFHADTIRVASYAPLAVYLAPAAIQLKQVTVHDTLQSPEKRLAATKRDYSSIYGSRAYSDLLTAPASGGAGLSIDALWNSISKSGRNASHLRTIIENDYQQNVIDYRFNRTFVGKITGLKDEKLTQFMQRYRPSYYLTATASDYEFIASIKANYRRFLRYPRRYALPELKTK